MIELRGHLAAKHPQGAFKESAHSATNLATGWSVGPNLRMQPCSGRTIRLSKATIRFIPPFAGRVRPASRASCQGLEPCSRRVESECSRCLVTSNGQEVELKLLSTALIHQK